MPKRRKQKSDDEGSEFEQASDSDASFSAKTRKGRVSSASRAPNKRKRPTKSTKEDLGAVSAWQHSQNIHKVGDPKVVRSALLAWYETVREIRGMPWRKPFNPKHTREERAQRAYEVWVSEIMLQQTQVATVIPYYNRWMSKFPTILALADIEEVNALWKGLGYYSRASRLLAGAQKVVRELSGLLPDNAKDMESKIPGIGRYSAGAICSIAYGEKVPVLDGNVHRLMSRFLMLHANPKSKATLDVLWTAAAAMVDVDGAPGDPNYQNPGDINQALIELGSTMCKVQNPSCSECPLNKWCSGYARQSSVTEDSETIGDIEDLCSLCEPLPSPFAVTALPMKAEKKKAREEVDIVSVVEWKSTAESEDRWFLLVRRPEKGLLAGLYEFPTVCNVAESDSKEAQSQAGLDLLSDLVAKPINRTTLTSKSKYFEGADESELHISQVKEAGDVLHIFSHVRKTYRSQWVVVVGGLSPPPITAKEMAALVSNEPSVKGKQKARAANPGDAPSSEFAKWVKLEEVGEQNISTGMVKIWRLAKSFWEG